MEGHPGEPRETVTVLWCTTDGDERRAARTLVVRSAADLLGVPASEIWVEHEPGGRPLLGGADQPLHISVAHARGALAVALTRLAPVGVDVEVVRRLSAAALARAWLDPAEVEWVTGLPVEEQSAGFLWLWTQKESTGKALGQGLREGGMSRRVRIPALWPPGDSSPLVLGRCPGAPDVVSGAVRVGRGSRIVGVAVRCGRAHTAGLDVRVRQVAAPEACEVPSAHEAPGEG